MTITKSTVQIAILFLSFAIAGALWVSKSQDAEGDETSPTPLSSASLPAASVKEAPPTRVTPSPVLDANALMRIKRADQLAQAQFDAEVAEAKARVRKANQQERPFGPTQAVPSVNVLADSPRVSPSTPGHLPMIDRLSLTGLVVKEGAAYAYLSLDGQTPIRIEPGQRIKGVLVSRISREGVQLTHQGADRTLGGGL